MEEDECWFSRFAQPRLHGWAEKDQELRLFERTPARDERDKALACFGAVGQDTKERFLYFCEGQPNSDKTILMLERLLAVARGESKRVLVLIWDRASWHKSRQLTRWKRQYNQKAKKNGDVRLLTCLLPIKSPWLNPMEAHWVHAKRQVAEPDGELSVQELKRRLCAVFRADIKTATLKHSEEPMH